MAGSYPNVPTNRIAYDIDGTVGLYIDSSGSSSQLSSGTVAALNNEAGGAGINSPFNAVRKVCLLFPQAVDLTGLYVRYTYTWDGQEWSTDTTNGVDGTWSYFSFSPNGGSISPSYRTAIQSVNLAGAKGIRFAQHSWSYDGILYQIHTYGRPSAGQTLDALQTWHPTLDQRVNGSFFDWGDAPRSSTEDRVFRIKNLSDTYTANDVVVSVQSLTDTTPSFAGSFLFSTGGSFTSTVTIPIIYPNGVSNQITVRRVTPSNAVLSIWAARMKAEATTWT